MLLYRIGSSTARLIGLFVYRCAPSLAEVPERNLRALFPDISEFKLQKTVREFFRQQGQLLFELFYFSLFPDQIRRIVRFDELDQELVKKARSSGKAMIFLSMHLGNWELLGGALVAYGLPLTSIYLRARSELQEKILNSYRDKVGIRLIDHDNILGVLRLIRKKEVLGLISDHDGGPNGIRLSWCGCDVSFPAGPARLSKRYGLPVVGIYLKRKKNGFHRIVLENLTSANPDESVEDQSRRYLEFYDQVVRKVPEQWQLFYDRFKKRTYGLD
ncbi:MAG: lysophospholipid acyltransferase family protein [Candidatus Wallbacteria bacterium]|nr:lysophospholipid acyltransferase family protein [Candidatus Wallbacteria bacterium]